MTPDETSPSPVDEQLLAELMAFDAHAARLRHPKERDAEGPPSPARGGRPGAKPVAAPARGCSKRPKRRRARRRIRVPRPLNDRRTSVARCWTASTSSRTSARAGSASWSAPATACWAARSPSRCPCPSAPWHRRRPPLPPRGPRRRPARPSPHRPRLRRRRAGPAGLLHRLGVLPGPEPAPLAQGAE